MNSCELGKSTQASRLRSEIPRPSNLAPRHLYFLHAVGNDEERIWSLDLHPYLYIYEMLPVV